MASIRLITRGKGNPSPLYIRFLNGRSLDIFYNTKIQVDPSEWDNSKSNYKNLKSIRNRVKQQARFEKLKSHVLYEFNEAYMMGELIDREWLENTVKSFFGRPIIEHNMRVSEHFLYYGKFVDWWLKEKAPTWRTQKNKYLEHRAIQQYESFLVLWRGFSTGNTKIRAVDSVMIGEFVGYLEKNSYSMATIKRHIGRLKFFLFRAETEGINIHPSSKERTFYTKEEEIDVPYLNEDEIEEIFKLDLTHDHVLDYIRDNFIIALWTGLRISDFNHNLSPENIDGGYINIVTQKTRTRVMLPIHPHVQSVLDKWNGGLPKRCNDVRFNKKIKVICMLANIDNEVKGKKFDKETKRKKVDYYKKWELITAHSARRSFATNLHGMVNNDILAELGGWADVQMCLHYIKRTKKESADKLKSVWKEKYNLTNQ
ncbi:tyrosine-type recombinase/integrase [Flagellimonas nanhaiensis]|uniref:Integrase n=1 Tax=Flagellimonas nanhaiensis TaxID=2292706 RepID=A0A371JLV9_9FLAO|nr:tyrosine-type recombinase/integrase [Allomuricauda nanhaiensis]RDY58021.1 integrase [Allomuricauda nanhaiensis]